MKRSRFGVENVFWRRLIDWSVAHIPALFHGPLIWVGATVFVFFAGRARRAVMTNLGLVLPGSWLVANWVRVIRVFANFGWSLTDTATHRILKPRFRYELERMRYLEQLASGRNAIVLTAHMGSYDLAASLFAQKFHRSIRMVRAPESDPSSTEHMHQALEQSGAGAVKVGYSNDGTALAFDLLSALRDGEIISIQGDRVVGDVAQAAVRFGRHQVFLPNGPFVLSLVADTPIYPIFIVRIGHRKYKIVAREPIVCERRGGSRDEVIANAMQRWAEVLQEMTCSYWPQWFAFTPLSSSHSESLSIREEDEA